VLSVMDFAESTEVAAEVEEVEAGNVLTRGEFVEGEVFFGSWLQCAIIENGIGKHILQCYLYFYRGGKGTWCQCVGHVYK